MLKCELRDDCACEFVRTDAAFAENISSTDYWVLRIRPSFSLKAQRLFEVERNDRRFCELQHKIAQGAGRNLAGNFAAFLWLQLRMAGVHFLCSRRNECVNQIVGLYAETLAAGDFNVGSRLVFLRKLISQLGGATWRERNHLIGEVSVMIRLLRVAESAQGLNDSVLRFGLARIDDVVNFSDIAEMGMIKCPNCG